MPESGYQAFVIKFMSSVTSGSSIPRDPGYQDRDLRRADVIESEEEEEEEEEEEDGDDDDEDMDGYQAMTQRLEHDTNKQQYDPAQDKSERRSLRQRYRELIQSAEDNRRELSAAESSSLRETISKANELYSQVRNTQEATLDSRLLVLSADLSVQKARNMRMNYNAFDTDEFVSKIISLGGGHAADSDDTQTELNWKEIGMHSIRFGKRPVTMDFMQGPLAVEKKQRTAMRQARITKNKEDLVQPQQLQEGDIHVSENDTAKSVNAIYRILHDRGPTNYFELVTNPTSFSQTVENIFYVSFLIRNAVASIDDASGVPIISIHEAPTADELGDGLTKKQIIMSIDMALWKEIIDTFDIRESIIPTRNKTMIAGGQWYG